MKSGVRYYVHDLAYTSLLTEVLFSHLRRQRQSGLIRASSQEFATVFASLLEGCSFLACVGNDNQDDIRAP